MKVDEKQLVFNAHGLAEAYHFLGLITWLEKGIFSTYECFKEIRILLKELGVSKEIFGAMLIDEMKELFYFKEVRMAQHKNVRNKPVIKVSFQRVKVRYGKRERAV